MRNTCSCAVVSGSFSQAVLVGLGGQKLHADQLIQYLILLLGSQLLLLALQQILHINVVFGVRYRRTVDDGHGRGHRLVRGGGRGGRRRLLGLAAGRQDGDGGHRGQHRPRRTKKLAHWDPLRKKATVADVAGAPGGGSL